MTHRALGIWLLAANVLMGLALVLTGDGLMFAIGVGNAIVAAGLTCTVVVIDLIEERRYPDPMERWARHGLPPPGMPLKQARRIAHQILVYHDVVDIGEHNGAITKYLMGKHDVYRMEELLNRRFGLR